jgi:hypothetical protein
MKIVIPPISLSTPNTPLAPINTNIQSFPIEFLNSEDFCNIDK